MSLSYHAPLTIDVHTSGILTLHGELDSSSARLLVDTGEALVEVGCTHVTIDCADLAFCGSAGLSALVHLSARLGPGCVRVVNRPPCLERALAITGLDGVIAR